ncbi:hypothetical protein JL193_05665 [Polaribacter batillariae]|uniref:Uncharacterized protein n=1 Tax=Polaribacter batillariae TaxID=2808900 RepID=A0ABX7SWY2_9FLAO|nr:hypothetical protein [Polaribacter batillariae]QTD38754.1 hypothetical protein JL193_05665 [Polaribacter batillariae]
MKKKTFLVLFTVLIFTCIVNGQIVPPAPGPPPPPPGLPVDGGLLFLLISGIIYGVKKVRE